MSGAGAGLTVARVLRARGRHGEVAAEILTDFPERLTRLRAAWLWDGRNPPRRCAVRSCWLSPGRGGQAIFHFEGCESIADARRLVGLEIQVPIAERILLPEGSYYVDELVDCQVWEASAEFGAAAFSLVGTVRDVQFLGEETRGTPLLVVETAAGELLIPLAQEICRRVDVANHRIEVALPEGLRDLNRRR